MESGARRPREALPAAGHSSQRLGSFAGGERREDHNAAQGDGESEVGPEASKPGAGLHPVPAEGAGGPAVSPGGVGERAERDHLHAECRRGARENLQACRKRGRAAQEDVPRSERNHRALEHI